MNFAYEFTLNDESKVKLENFWKLKVEEKI